MLEATDEVGEQFGFERLERRMASGSSQPREVAERLQRELREHVGDAPQYDDVTLIVLGVTDGCRARAASRRRDEPTQTVRND